MPSITKQRVGKYTYLYESTSYWDKEKGPRNKKVAIGRMDPESGEAIYKSEYLARKSHQSKSNQQCADNTMRKELLAALDSIKDFGTSYFLLEIATSIGLSNTLKQTLPQHWKEVLTSTLERGSYASLLLTC